MRHLFLSTALVLVAAPVLADQIEIKAPVRDVTLYPYGASVTRVADVTAPAGTHELIITGMPDSVDAANLRVSAEGAKIGAVSFQRGRAMPADTPKSEAVIAAESEVQRLERALNERDANVAKIRARSAAADDTIQFLKELAGADNPQPVDIATLTTNVGQQMLRARETAIAAETEARAMEQGREDDEEALQTARDRLNAVRDADAGRNALVIAIETGADPAKIAITGFSTEANWQPVYDLRLDRAAKKLTLDRGLLVSQNTGEDWQDAKLTLSTARPSEQSAPSVLYPWLPYIEDPAERERAAKMAAPTAEMANAGGFVAPVTDVESVVADSVDPRMMGATVVYDYAAPVTIRTGVDALRLKMDIKELAPEIYAEAVPRRDASAYLVAETSNALKEVILPGRATLYADEAMVGQIDLDLTPAGEKMKIGFGPIDGLIAEYRVPDEQKGDRGILTRSNTRSQVAVLTVRNVTDQDWPLRIMGQVPVSAQKDLKVTWSADPRPTKEEPERIGGEAGDNRQQRGILEWDSTIKPGETQEVTLTTEMTWPDGMEIYGDTN